MLSQVVIPVKARARWKENNINISKPNTKATVPITTNLIFLTVHWFKSCSCSRLIKTVTKPVQISKFWNKTNQKNISRFFSPTQFPKKGQWWSNIATHSLHWEQWRARKGWSLWQTVQNKLSIIKSWSLLSILASTDSSCEYIWGETGSGMLGIGLEIAIFAEISTGCRFGTSPSDSW